MLHCNRIRAVTDYRASVAARLAESGDAARLAALAHMADAAAHEFNNLRSAIEGTLDLIAANPAVTIERRLARLRKASAKAEAVAGGMAALARLRRGADTELDVGGWLRAARPWLLARLDGTATLALEVPPEPVPMAAHPDSLRAVLRALVENAAAAVEGRGCITIALARGKAPGRVSLSVADDGAGMTPEVAARAREPFFTTRPAAAGLGLTLAELFAREHGGTLELSSTPGSGTIVSLRLPEAGAGLPAT